LTNNVDWALSRNRYWGTPLPIWRCDDGHLTAVGSLRELSDLAGRDVSEVDPHRPYVDDIEITCPECGSQARRVPEVIDCWYDSGAMPFAALGYPHHNTEAFEDQYPADFICEAIDQTRGWFYSLMAVGTLVFDKSSYKNVVCLGHILDEDGRKMSKHLGNVLEPIPLMDEHGADAVRWFMLASGSPWQARRVGHAAIADVVRRTLLTYWNTVSFLSLYARTAGWQPSDGSPEPIKRPIIDRWVLSEANRVARDVDDALENFDTQRGGRILAEFVDDLSNWYVRRSRRRFWDGDPAALATLNEALRIITLCLAPYTPFIAERVWQDLFRPTDANAPTSVHLAAWPTPDESEIDDDLAGQMALIRRIVELGRAARASSSVRTRQPLSRALVSAPGWPDLPAELVAEVADELNVRAIESLGGAADLVDVAVKPNFRELGKRFAKKTPAVAQAIAGTDPSALVAELRASDIFRLTVDGEDVDIHGEDVIVTETPREGWTVASDAEDSVAIDLHIDDDLRRAGLARELIRAVQEARKSSGFEITDRIELVWDSADDDISAVFADHGITIADEVLAVKTERSQPPTDMEIVQTDLPVHIGIRKTPIS
jgi:isoleucyl-tRNA synthetase